MRAWLPSGNKFGLVKPATGGVIDGAARFAGGLFLFNDIVDSAGNNPRHTYNGTITRVAGAFGGVALGFDGATGFLDIPLCPANFLSASAANAFTIWAWVNGAVATPGIIASKGNNSPNTGINFGCGSTLFFGAIGASNMRVDATTASPAAGQWHFVAATWDGAMGGGGVALYLDGVSVAVTIAQAGSTQNGSDTFDLLLGKTAGSGTSAQANGGGFFNGSIDHLGFDRRVYTPAEIADLYVDPFGMMLTGEGDAPLFSSGASAPTPYDPWPQWSPLLAQ